MEKKNMKKWIVTLFLTLWLCIGWISLIHSSFQTTQLDATNLQTRLTHDVEHIYTMDYFNVSGSQYLYTEGNDSAYLLAGHYPARYSFENDAAGSEPADWTSTHTAKTNISVQSLISNHRNVVRLWAYKPDTAIIKNDWGQDRENGTVELWIRGGLTGNDNTEIELMDGTNQAIYMWFDWGTGKLESYTDTYVTLASILVNKWYHLRINFTITTWIKNYDVFLNKSQVGTDITFMTNRTHLDSLRITEVSTLHANSLSYIDAVDYSWAPDYYLNRNWNNSYFSAGSYIISNITLPTGFAHNITVYANIPENTDLTSSFYIEGYGWLLLGSLNWTLESPIVAGNYHYMLNFTSDGPATPEVFGLAIFYAETIANEYPNMQDILVTFDNETLQATISCLITDPDNDTMDIFLCLPLGDILANQTALANGTVVSFVYQCEYSAAYSFYLNATDSEDAVQSSLFGWSTGAEPEEPEEPEPTADFIPIYVLFGIIGCGLIALVLTPDKRK
jgi:hypothetical protein